MIWCPQFLVPLTHPTLAVIGEYSFHLTYICVAKGQLKSLGGPETSALFCKHKLSDSSHIITLMPPSPACLCHVPC